MSGQIRALVVDDHPLGRRLLEAHLRLAGYETLVAGDGDEALEILGREAGRIDVVLLDRRMPRMDGIEVLARLKKDPVLAEIPVILQTAADGQEEVVEGIRAGAYYYLTKPFVPEVLLSITAAAVEDHVRYRRLRDEVQRQVAGLGMLSDATFHFRTVDEANRLAITLAAACPNPRSRVIGLSELLINAVEHGNLGISWQAKSELVARKALAEEIRARLDSVQWGRRHARLRFRRLADRIELTITDQGEGFDWRNYLQFSPDRAHDTHGRGIALARALSFDDLTYRGRGNEVVATVRLPESEIVAGRPTAASDDGMAAALRAVLTPPDRLARRIEEAHGVTLGALFEPRRAVGGDLWGLAPLDETRFAVWLGDMTGHGPQAALDAHALQVCLRRMPPPADPAEALSQLGDALAGLLPTGRYATIVLGVVDRARDLFTYAASAIPHPCVIDPARGMIHEGDGSGVPAGIARGIRYPVRELPFPPGATLFLHSDGIESVGRAFGEAVGKEGVAAILAEALAGTPLDEALNRRLDPLPRPLDDDVSAVWCRRA